MIMSVLYLKPSSHFPSYLKFRTPYSDLCPADLSNIISFISSPIMFLPHVLSLSLPPLLEPPLLSSADTLVLDHDWIGCFFSFRSQLQCLIPRDKTYFHIPFSFSTWKWSAKKPLIVWFPCWLVRWLVSSFLPLPTSSMREGLCVSPFLICSPCPYPFCWWMNEWISMPKRKYTHKSCFRDRMDSKKSSLLQEPLELCLPSMLVWGTWNAWNKNRIKPFRTIKIGEGSVCQKLPQSSYCVLAF